MEERDKDSLEPLGDYDDIEQIDELETFDPVDVSEPQEIYRERDLIRKALELRRLEWLRSHMMLVFILIGVIIVGLTVFFIQMYFVDVNPVKRFSSALYKDFGAPFRYDISLTENGESQMHYDGTISVDRSGHSIEALYEADYNDYTYTGAAACEGNSGVAGYLYEGEWSTHDCTELALNFFDFDADFRTGGFDCGAFIRFTGLTSDYSISDTAKIIAVVKKRLSMDSTLATITGESTDNGEHYHYDVDLYQLFLLVKQDGAAMFARSADYDAFKESFEHNKGVLENSKCTIDFFIDNDGYMTSFDLNVTAQDVTYGLSCKMSDFGTAAVALPDEFLKAAESASPTEY